MAFILKYTAQALIDQAAVSADFAAYNELNHDFRRAILQRFVKVRDNIENWQEAITNKALLAGRLQTIAAKNPATWTENNLLDMALICSVLFNIAEV